ncbi:hypothetical protein pb186bvf_011346 [Paramecium bursaria]
MALYGLVAHWFYFIIYLFHDLKNFKYNNSFIKTRVNKILINKLIVDSQTQVSGILFFNDQEQNISIWIRPQPRFLSEDKIYDQVIPYAIINNRDGQVIVKLAYDVMDDLILIFAETQQEKFYFCHYKFRDYEGKYIELMWIQLSLYKSTENLEKISFLYEQFSLSNKKLQPFTIYSWQSKLFSCYIYDQIENLSDSFLILYNDKLQLQITNKFINLFQIFQGLKRYFLNLNQRLRLATVYTIKLNQYNYEIQL